MSAVSTRTLNLLLTAENVTAPAFNELNQSLTNTARVSSSAYGSMSKSSGLVSQQMYILRRSAEYAIAGLGIYKIYEAVDAYKSFRSELGQLNTTLGLSATALNSLGKAAIQVSNNTAQPLQSVLESFQNIAQQYPTLPKASIAKFAQIEAQTANIMGANPADVGSTVGALATAFYGRTQILNPKTGPALISKIADMLVLLQKKGGLPNASGEDILTAAQTLVGGAKVGRFTLPQSLSYFDILEKQIASPSKASLYLRQLMSRIITPTPSEAAYYAQARLPSGTQLAGLTGNQIIQGLVKAVISQPGSNMTYTQAQAAGFKNVKLGPEGIQLLEKAIGGRIQSGIAASLIVSGWAQYAGIQKTLAGASQKDIDTRNQSYLSQIALQQAGVKISNLSVTMLQDLSPLIQGIGTYAADMADYLMSANTFLTRGSGALDQEIKKIPIIGGYLAKNSAGGILEAMGLGVGAVSLKKLLTSDTAKMIINKGTFGKAFAEKEGEGQLAEKMGKYLEKSIQGPLDVKELESALVGKANGTPGSPFWVVIAPLSMQTIPFLANKGPSKLNLQTEAEKLAAKGGTTVAKTLATLATGAAGGIGVEEGISKGALAKQVISRVKKLGRSAPKDIADAQSTIEDEFTHQAKSAATAAKVAAKKVKDLGPEDFFEGGFADAAKDVVSKGALRAVAERLGGPLGIGAMLLTSSTNLDMANKAAKGMSNIQVGDYARQVKKGSLADIIANPQSNISFGYAASHKKQVSQILKLHKDPAVQKDLMEFVKKQISATTLNRLLETAAQGQGTQFFVSQAGIPSTVAMPDSVETTFYLVPTAEFKGLIEPQKVRGSVPIAYVNANSKAPKSRGKNVKRRT